MYQVRMGFIVIRCERVLTKRPTKAPTPARVSILVLIASSLLHLRSSFSLIQMKEAEEGKLKHGRNYSIVRGLSSVFLLLSGLRARSLQCAPAGSLPFSVLTHSRGRPCCWSQTFGITMLGGKSFFLQSKQEMKLWLTTS